MAARKCSVAVHARIRSIVQTALKAATDDAEALGRGFPDPALCAGTSFKTSRGPSGPRPSPRFSAPGNARAAAPPEQAATDDAKALGRGSPTPLPDERTPKRIVFRAMRGTAAKGGRAVANGGTAVGR